MIALACNAIPTIAWPLQQAVGPQRSVIAGTLSGNVLYEGQVASLAFIRRHTGQVIAFQILARQR